MSSTQKEKGLKTSGKIAGNLPESLPYAVNEKEKNDDAPSFLSSCSAKHSSASLSHSSPFDKASLFLNKKRNAETMHKVVSFAVSSSSSISSSSTPIKQTKNPSEISSSIPSAANNTFSTSISPCIAPSHSSSSSSSSSSSMYVVPSMASEIENILNEMGVQKYEERVVHMLIDILQRETLTILNGAGELAALRMQNAKENLNLKKRSKNMYINNNNSNSSCLQSSNNNNDSSNNYEGEDDIMIIQREDSELAVNEYNNKYVLNPSALEDSMRLSATTNALGCTSGEKDEINHSFPFYSSSTIFPVSVFPSTLGPYLPEDVNVNTIVPGWDLKVFDEFTEEKDGMNFDQQSKNDFDFEKGDKIKTKLQDATYDFLNEENENMNSFINNGLEEQDGANIIMNE